MIRANKRQRKFYIIDWAQREQLFKYLYKKDKGIARILIFGVQSE